ncbi:hypothetical protein CLOP_g25334 [Closterium sp. NIES-67]|nr:hypothetical protein CLOP_g25333 [Closterium sp. NIES-67]GJP68667.1 hypothetical protein CLOP_g25334 [Closterium sp. NIES-67]
MKLKNLSISLGSTLEEGDGVTISGSKALAEKAAADAGRRPRGLKSAVLWVCVEGNFHSRNKLLRHRLLGQVR